MPVVNETIRSLFRVTDIAGAPVTGLADGAFTKTLRRRDSAGTYVSASETVTVVEKTGGDYEASFVPVNSQLYVLDITHATHFVSQRDTEFQVLAGFVGSGGPYLTTRANVKTALKIDGTDDDARIDALVAQVTDEWQTYCGRVFAQDTLTEYPDVLGNPLRAVFLARPPVASITSIHISTALPRVYDSTTLLVEGTDFEVDSNTGIVEFATSRSVNGLSRKMVRAIYLGGYATVPGDVERAVIEVIAAKLAKGRDQQYHLTSKAAGDGSLSGIRFDDWTDDAMRVMDKYRIRRFA